MLLKLKGTIVSSSNFAEVAGTTARSTARRKREAISPYFIELVVLNRIAEDKQSLKEERMRKHLGLNRHAPVPLKLRRGNYPTVCVPGESNEKSHVSYVQSRY